MQSGPQRDLGMEKTDNGESDWETGQAGAQCHSWELTTQRHGDGKASAHNLAQFQKRHALLRPFCSKLWKDIVDMTLKRVLIFTKALMEMFTCEYKQESFLIHTQQCPLCHKYTCFSALKRNFSKNQQFLPIIWAIQMSFETLRCFSLNCHETICQVYHTETKLSGRFQCK